MTEGVASEHKQGTWAWRIDGLLDRSLTALKQLAALTGMMESRSSRGPTDYPTDPSSGIYVNYGGSPAPTREPSWQGYLAKIVAVLITTGVGSLVWILSAMNGRLSTIEANQGAGMALIQQRLDAQEKHLEAHDKQLDEVNREIWPHRR